MKIRPDRMSPYAGSGYNFRYYGLCYSREPWQRSSGLGTFYEVHLYPPNESESWKAHVLFRHSRKAGEVNFDFPDILDRISHSHEWKTTNKPDQVIVELESNELNNDFADEIAKVLRNLIERITPVVDALANESYDEA